jgi:hypothetical protein
MSKINMFVSREFETLLYHYFSNVMTTTNTAALFEGREIRRTMYNEEWRFSVEDIVFVLTESSDPRQYIKKMRNRDEELKLNWGTICTPLKMIAKDGKLREVFCVNAK